MTRRLPPAHGSNKAAIEDRVSRRQQLDADAQGRYTQRDPCFACGIPYDRHDTLGCRRWRQR